MASAFTWAAQRWPASIYRRLALLEIYSACLFQSARCLSVDLIYPTLPS